MIVLHGRGHGGTALLHFRSCRLTFLLQNKSAIAAEATTAPTKSRIGRMWGYWWDAKEAELKARADQVQR